MSAEVHGLDQFYASPTGIVAKRLLRAKLRAVWPELAGSDVLGVGYAGPYLRLWRRRAARLISVVPVQGPPPGRLSRWPADGPCALALTEEENLPFPDLSFDNVLMVHGLEHADHTRRMLREVWRVLRDEGRLLVVVPNRRSIWAHLDHTPLGHGQPYTSAQLARLLERGMFHVERRDGALFVPPFRSRLLLRTARLWEGAGRALSPKLSGVTIMEARKEVFGALPLRSQPSGRRVTVPAWVGRGLAPAARDQGHAMPADEVLARGRDPRAEASR
ncbi:Probable S-adenosylmethionine-dependent methyltransferase MSMEG_2350 [Roseomonas gilardii subsp. rosea]|nr:Probable S-adenosylmethionine-dependent methyltransferase MSMEG_2350 [Roseomonas gilardii subsp. rosea]